MNPARTYLKKELTVITAVIVPLRKQLFSPQDDVTNDD
jgi:hypothetical protein